MTTTVPRDRRRVADDRDEHPEGHEDQDRRGGDLGGGEEHGAAPPVLSSVAHAGPTTVADVDQGLRSVGYLPERARRRSSPILATKLGKPVLVEGPAGVGKTELAKALRRYLDRELVRLQCYEGLDEAKALYEWNYRKQLLRIQAEARRARAGRRSRTTSSATEFLLERPLMTAIASPEPVVLLIDEIDKTDQEFEAMLLEVLSDFQISIPELGRIEARTHPVVLLTSNNTRELTEALKRRCLYLWLDYPDARARAGDRAAARARARRRRSRASSSRSSGWSATSTSRSRRRSRSRSTGRGRCCCSARRTSTSRRSATRCR